MLVTKNSLPQLLLAALLLFLAGCGVGLQPTLTPMPTAIPTVTPTPAPTPTPTPRPGTPRDRPSDGMVLLYVPAGDFVMGSSDVDLVNVLAACPDCQREWFSDEQPAHSLHIDAFWIDQTEVSNAQFANFMSQRGNQVEDGVTWLDLESGSGQIEPVGALYQPREGYDQHPVTGVSWHGAAAYCQWAGGRLPSEAKWEYAARGPAGLVYPWGNEFDCAGGNFANGATGCTDGYAEAAPVGGFAEGASWCQALDMAGNVWEWVADTYDSGYYARSPSQNPPGPEPGAYRVLRGGAWNVGAWAGRGAHRGWNTPPDRSMFVGFRCVVPAE